MEDQGILLVDGWQVDADSHRISRDGVEKKLEPRSMELLVYLAHRFEQVIPREEIEANVWHGRVVGYEALSGAVAKLRKAFDDTSKVHRVIETIPKSGYRLIAPVSRKNPTGEPATESVDAPAAKTKNWMSMVGATVLVVVVFGLAWWQPWITREEPASVERMAFSLPDKPSIAILPFTNMSDDPEQRYFADGMTDDLITDLSKISGLFVISRNSAFTYKDGSSAKLVGKY
jgi:DNA-binding winged helix-turn-helix (wHTH) protein